MSPPGDDADRKPGLVLIVEHEAAVAELARRYLERDGLMVRVAGTPADAAAALRGGPPAVVILDLTMPGLTPGVVRRRLPLRGHAAATELICLEGPGGLRPRHVGVAGRATGAPSAAPSALGFSSRASVPRCASQHM